MFPTLLRRVALVALLAGGPLALVSVEATAAPSVCKKKKAKKAKIAPITSKTIKAWQVQGLSDDEIVERCNRAGYQPSAKGVKGMKKAKVRPSLIAALTGATPPAAEVEVAAEPVARKIDLTQTVEVDFDAVPPPPGTPGAAAYAQKHPAKAEVKVVEKKAEATAPKTATFVPKPVVQASADGPKPKRVVYSAAN